MEIGFSTEKSTMGKIIQAAIPLFSAKGFSNVSVKEIAEAAGVNVALISYYFGGKESLYTLILEQHFADVGQEMAEIKKGNLPIQEKLRRYVQTVIVSRQKNPYFDQLLYSERMNPTERGSAILRQALFTLHGYFKDCIGDAVHSGEFRPDIDPDSAAWLLFGMIKGLCIAQRAKYEGRTYRHDEMNYYIEQSLGIYLHGALCNE